VEISGHLTRSVKFGGGLLGHLDAGGHFYVKQEEVQPGNWELAVLEVEMKGRALFFKTVGVQEEMKRSMFQRVRDDLTAAQGANLLYQQVRTTSKISVETETAVTSDLPTRWPLGQVRPFTSTFGPEQQIFLNRQPCSFIAIARRRLVRWGGSLINNEETTSWQS